MKCPRQLVLTLLVAVSLGSGLAACAVLPSGPTPAGPGGQAVGQSPPQPSPTLDLPPADEVAFAFLQAWQRQDYPAMYSLLSPEAQHRYPEARFAEAYATAARVATMEAISPRILAAYQPDTRANVSFEVTVRTAAVGDFAVQNQMTLAFDQGRWGVEWSPAVILPQLNDDTFLQFTPQVPSRGNIYDRNGLGLAVQGEMVEVGVIPGKIEDETTLLTQLGLILGQAPEDLKAKYAGVPADWYVPLGRITAEAGQLYYEVLGSLPGVELRNSWIRSYRPEIVAPHVVGVVGPIPQEEADEWSARGYAGDEMVGRLGLERWGEPYLAGKRGGRLEILTTKGQRVAVLAEKPAQENSSLYATLDREFQKKVQDILGQRLGAIAVLEATTGRVLALATYPTFDPNLFATGIRLAQWQVLQADAQRPLVNRATQGTYPAGSTFKVVTMMAGMGSGGLTGGSPFVCKGTWTGLGPQWPKTCWLGSGHGKIPLGKALTVSCDITFYQVGMLLDGLDQELLPDYARRCGFGAPTGIEVEEDAGLVPDPAWKLQTKGEGWAPGDSVNLAIGQAELQVTPLQLAVLMAAVGNGGTLYRPQVVEMVAADPQRPEKVFQTVALGQIPALTETLTVIQDSLYKVTSDRLGTAYAAFAGLSVPVAGKTGTAESGQEQPHAWFAGYAPAQGAQIAIAVIIEHAGQGGSQAAPLFRQVVETYFGLQSTVELTSTVPAAPVPAAAPTAVP